MANTKDNDWVRCILDYLLMNSTVGTSTTVNRQ